MAKQGAMYTADAYENEEDTRVVPINISAEHSLCSRFVINPPKDDISLVTPMLELTWNYTSLMKSYDANWHEITSGTQFDARHWSTPRTFYVIAQPDASTHVAGFVLHGEADVSFEGRGPSRRPIDKIHGRIPKITVDLDVDSDYDGYIENDDDPIEVSAGGLVCLSDNLNTGLTSIKLSLTAGTPVGNDVRLFIDEDEGDGKIRIWNSAAKTTEVDLTQPFNLGTAGTPKYLYVEGIVTSTVPRDVTLRLQYARADGSYLCEDMIKLTVVQTDVDVDSDYDGDVDNDDDPLEESAGGFAATNVLRRINLAVYPRLTTGGMILSAASGGDKIKVWADQNKTTEVRLDKPWSVASFPDSLYVEGIKASDTVRDVQLSLCYTNKTFSCRDEIKLTSVKVELDIDVDDDGDKDAADRAMEDSAPGGIVFVNWDDDNNNGMCDYDYSETGISGEDEIVSIALDIEPSLTEGTVTLEVVAGGSHIRIWESSTKTGPVLCPITLPKKTWDLTTEILPDVLYVEAIDKSGNEGDTKLQLKWENGGSTVCNDKITLTCVKINLALAAYRSPVNIAGSDFNHAALVSGYGGTDPYGIDATEGTGLRRKAELLTLANYHIMEMPGQNQAAAASTLQGFVNQHNLGGWPGASHEYLVSNPGLANHDDLRLQILDNAEAVQAVVQDYCWNDAVEGPLNTVWDGTIAGIQNLRCDGLVEVVYELAGVQVWGRDWMNYPIQTYPEEHNTIGLWPDPDRLSPRCQRGGIVDSPSRFASQPLVEPTTMEPHQ